MSLCPSGKVPYHSRRQLKRYLRSKGMQKNRTYLCDCGYFHHTTANHKVSAWYREHR